MGGINRDTDPEQSNAKPLVSIITPSYNQGKFIRATVESVLSQDYLNIEYIVVDGASTDDTLSILNEYKDRLQLISEPDNGQTDAINKGIRLAKGSIIAYLNSDDIYLPGAISRVVHEFQQAPDTDFIYGDFYAIDADGKVFDKIKSIPFDRKILLYDANYISQPASFYRKSLFEKIGLLNDKLQCLMDYDFFLRAANERINFKLVRKPLAAIRYHAECKTLGGAEDLEISRVRKEINSQYIPRELQNPTLLKLVGIIYRVKRYMKIIARGRLDFMNLSRRYHLKKIVK